MGKASPLFYERFSMQVEGVNRYYTKVKILVWDGTPDGFCQPRVRLVWWVLDDGSFGQPDIEIEESVWSAPRACRLAQRVLKALRPFGAWATPSDFQAALAKLRASKCVHPERYVSAEPVAAEQYRPV